MKSPVDPWDFSPSELVAEAWGVARAQVKLFLQWAFLPIVLGVVAEILANIGLDLMNNNSSQLAPLFVAAWGLWIIGGWFSAPYHVRVYRFVALGETPRLFYGLQLWEERTWRLIWKTVAVNIQAMLLSMVITVLPGAFVSLALNRYGIADDSVVFKYVVFSVIPTLGWLAAIYILTARMVLVYPGAALDTGYHMADYGYFGHGGKRRIAQTMVLIWGPVTLLQQGLAFGALFLWSGNLWLTQILGLFAYALSVYTAMASMSAGALLHKRAAPYFQDMAEERAALRKEISETPSMRL